MNVDVSVDVSRAIAKLRGAQRDQIPYAVSLALNDTATQVQNLLTNKLPEFFDRPTSFTMRAIGTTRATKTSPVATVFIKRDQAKYLTYGVQGGVRLPNRRAIPIPVDIDLNAYGNMPRGKLKSLLQRKDVFSGIVHGVGGLWQRKAGDKLVLLVAWKAKAKYKARYPFYTLGADTARAAFPSAMRKALDRALKTAR